MNTHALPDTTSLPRVIARGTPLYEATRRATCFNARVPERYPDLIVQARSVAEVVAAVRYARATGMRVSVRSGGHSWSANHLRDGDMLLDVSALDGVSVDRAGMRAVVGPGCAGNRLASILGRQGLFFPAGHCLGVCVGGYLLQGGFGWHSRVLGPACMSVEAIDVVTADGECVHASATENADLYWSARGAGAGFFGVVTRFCVRVYPAPKVTGFALQTFPLSELEAVYRWADAVSAEVPGAVEFQIVMTQKALGVGGPGFEVFAPVFANSWREARAALDFIRTGPVRPRARLTLPFVPAPLWVMYRMVMSHYPNHHRYAVDNMWTHAPIDALLPGLEAIARTLPPPPSHVLWLNWAPPANRPDMAFSMEDRTYLALYGCWKHAEDDSRWATWAVDHMRAMAPLASGCQLADENLGQRPARFVADDNLRRLDAARAQFDASGVFRPWMGRP